MAEGPVVRAGLGFGGNLGDPATQIRAALDAVAALPSTRLLAASSLYRSRAWGVTDQPDFINACAIVETGLSARGLLDACLAIERTMGRDRAAALRWGPRLIDIDLLFHGEDIHEDATLTLPHPHLFTRNFVLAPLAEIAPELSIAGRSVAEALAALGMEGLQKRP